ncbi:sensor histidine kinase [Halalkalibacterium halodurans]|uniref:histidine kinase n=2 Tax=Halalkalibacterium halodurans TaxID=86665 RepID=Q9KE08_HALH5|nr:sensor histidine kinase [Halalkalibacterium halodurans]MED4083185.1 sensor histidine kinase [Halalkalibacterium halodurans]MED4086627.1 sensor histidine kinase [Halalkalibacterium halodurans]MED4107160.1 sensor histidine kinase [Halalkalibacterium halodurans]MED4124086.1 sensor histidine kinase [Halalkalibacterium halodurans]MED4151261.1 sensor histidine kinase [Halalkalibacterium halodurans]
MISFVLTSGFLVLLWALIVINELPMAEGRATFLFVVASWLAIYFLRPLIQMRRLWQFVLVLSFLMIHLVFLSPDSFYPWGMYYFFILDLAWGDKRVKPSHKFEYVAIITLSLIPYLFHTYSYPMLFHLIVLTGMTTFALSMSKLKKTYDELESKWTSFLVEYRALKRHAYQSEQNARAEERTRIARDMHDSVGHQLTTLMMQLEITERTATGEIKSLVSQAKQMARESLNETRQAVRALSQKTYGMASVLQLIRKLEAESHVRVQLTTKEGVLSAPLTNDQYVTVYRFVQEGITNAMRHGHSREVAITLEVIGGNSYQMSVENRIYSSAPFEKGFGLSNLTDRLEALNGRLDVLQTENLFRTTGVFPIKEG